MYVAEHLSVAHEKFVYSRVFLLPCWASLASLLIANSRQLGWKTVCPYKDVTQQENGARRSSISLGKGPRGNSWAPGQRGKRLVMTGGAHCPPIGTGRKTEIQFECGDKDALLRVEEFETCVYGTIAWVPPS
jgi:hypothetical protein